MEKRSINILVDSEFNKEYLDYLNEMFDVKKTYTYRDLEQGVITTTKQVDLVVFTGGADVDPALYDEKVGKYTYISEKRDTEESTIYRTFSKTVPKLGICRGAQFLTVKNGGKLIQHVEGHNSSHEIEVIIPVNKNKIYNITSSHHQMMYPFDLNAKKYQLIGWSKIYNSNVYLNGDNEQMRLSHDFLEPEIVLYPDTKSLCIQGHPEYSNCPEDTRKLTLLLINDLLNDTKS